MLAAIVPILAAGLLIASLRLGDGDGRALAREGGSLLAPTSDAMFSDAFGAPGTPTTAIPVSEPGDAQGTPAPEPTPPAPGPTPPGPVEPPPPDQNLFGLLRDLLVPPPPPGATGFAAPLERSL